MKGSTRNVILVALILSAVGACGGDSSSGGSESSVAISTGLPLDRKLSSFSDQDAQQACQALSDGASAAVPYSELVHAQCASYAIGKAVTYSGDGTVGIDQTKCSTMATSCEADPESAGLTVQGIVDESDCSTATADQSIKSCDATVAEYEACVNQVLTVAKQTLMTLSCENGTTLIHSGGSDTTDALNPENMPECKAFLDKCPDVQLTASIGN